jgi:uncharacterized surface protein with fasciclin (FAS1) repeats
MVRRIAVALALAAAVTVTVVPAGAGSTTGQGNLVQTATASGQFKTLVMLLRKAGLAQTLARTGPYTVFAPTDAAFAKVPKATVNALLADRAKLRSVLLYHVVRGKVTAAQLAKRTSVATLAGGQLTVRSTGSAILVNKAKVISADVVASNGVIHVINGVLVPPR